MKTLKTMFALLLAAFFSTSCSSDNDNEVVASTFNVENPLATYYSKTGFTTSVNFINSGNYEFGLVFTPTVKGNIKAITLQLPDANPVVRVTIWDFVSKAVLRSETVNVATANVAVVKAISELALEKDKKYMITMNSNDWYEKAKEDKTNATYPVIAGNIKFEEYRWGSGTTQTFPANISLDYNGGDLSFDFQQTE